MEFVEREIEYYETESGKIPFKDWFNDLKDVMGRSVIRARIDRVSLGNFGFCQPVGEGVLELKIDYGPGYRIYIGLIETRMVILLNGGDKHTQQRDINMAKIYWMNYRRRHEKQK